MNDQIFGHENSPKIGVRSNPKTKLSTNSVLRLHRDRSNPKTKLSTKMASRSNPKAVFYPRENIPIWGYTDSLPEPIKIFLNQYQAYKDTYLPYFEYWQNALKKHPKIWRFFIKIEHFFPFSGLFFTNSVIFLASLRLKENFKRRLNCIFTGVSGIGKDIINIYPDHIRNEETIIQKLDRATLRGFDTRIKENNNFFKNSAHVYGDLTSLQTLPKQSRLSWFNFYNVRLDTDNFDDSTFFAEPILKEHKKGVVTLLASCTAEYLHKLRFNKDENLTESTFWDRLMYYHHNLNQDQIDMGDQYVNFSKNNKAISQVDITHDLKNILIRGKGSFKQYNVEINEKEFMKQITQIRNCIYLSKAFIREKEVENKQTKEKYFIIQSGTSTRRSNEQAIRFLKSIALLRDDKLSNTEVTQDDIDLAIKLLANYYFKQNKYWKIYYYMLSKNNPVTYKTFEENPNSFFRISRPHLIRAMDYLEEQNFIVSEIRKNSAHEKVFYLNNYQGDDSHD